MTQKRQEPIERLRDNEVWRVELPIPIEPSWDPTWGPLLAGFPLQLIYSGMRPQHESAGETRLVSAAYFVDPGSFHNDQYGATLRYVPKMANAFYIVVKYCRLRKRWETNKFNGNRLIAQATGSTFERAMIQTLLVGLQPDEPAR